MFLCGITTGFGLQSRRTTKAPRLGNVDRGERPQGKLATLAGHAIARQCRTITGTELDALNDEALALTVADVSVYARVNPNHKLRIVKALQAKRNAA